MPTYPSLTSVLPTRYEPGEPDYPGLKTEYPDGGADLRSLADVPIKRWAITYAALTTAEAAQFDTLINDVKYNRAEGSLLPLTFTPRGESAQTVWIDSGGYEHTHGEKAWVHNITVKLIKRP